ncbi:hypothetical protein F5Y07DRAFT_155014 [Xylaria sp. FL0933]|nr:hypothetical protein F5Y07DRAFT_155014 [Xylaria sp. FL0933]
MAAPDYVLDPNGDVIITLRNFNAPFPPLPFEEVCPAWDSLEETVVSENRENDDTDLTKDDPSELLEQSVRLQVSSSHLKLSSPYFKKALDGPFKESYSTADGLRHIDADGWDKEAFVIVMQILHGRNRPIPRRLDLEMLAKVAVIVDYYNCHESVEPFAEIWHNGIDIPWSKALNIINQDLIIYLFVSWVFDWEGELRATTKVAQNLSEGPLSTMGLPIPELIISIINHRRLKELRRIGASLHKVFDRFRTPLPKCTEECASIQLGFFERQILHSKGLRFHTSIDASLIGFSVASAIEAVQEIKSPTWYHNPSQRRPHGCSFTLDRILKDELFPMQELPGLGRLDLQFGPPPATCLQS